MRRIFSFIFASRFPIVQTKPPHVATRRGSLGFLWLGGKNPKQLDRQTVLVDILHGKHGFGFAIDTFFKASSGSTSTTSVPQVPD